jgi:hypothetical protein
MSETNPSIAISTNQRGANCHVLVPAVNHFSDPFSVSYDCAVGFKLNEILIYIIPLKCILCANSDVLIFVFILHRSKMDNAYLIFVAVSQ